MIKLPSMEIYTYQSSMDGPGTHSPLDLDQIREQARQRLPVQGKVVERLVDLIGDIATEARNQALEEAERQFIWTDEQSSGFDGPYLVHTRREIVDVIRSLKDKEA